MEKEELDLSMGGFPGELLRSITYQIYLYFLSHSQIFVYYMLPILPNLLAILKFFSREDKI